MIVKSHEADGNQEKEGSKHYSMTDVKLINGKLKQFIELYESHVNFAPQEMEPGQDIGTLIQQAGLQKKLFRGMLLDDWKKCKQVSHHQAEVQDLSMEDVIKDPFTCSDYVNYFQLIEPEDDEFDLNKQSQESLLITVEVVKKVIDFKQEKSFLIIIKNITAIIDNEKQKNEQQYQQLLLASVSHEMMTPLNAIINLSSLMKKKFEKTSSIVVKGQALVNKQSRHQDSENAGLLKVINSSACLMKYLVQDFLDLVSLMGGSLKVQSKISSIRTTCEEVIDLFEIQLMSKGLNCNLDIKYGTPEAFYFDSEKYKQILLILVQNSIKFTNQGSVDIYVEYESQMCSSRNTCGRLVTTVKDTGVGIDETTQMNLFKIFGNSAQLKESGVVRKNGIGIGLTICKQLINYLGGSIAFESQVDKGTSFKFSIFSKCKDCEMIQIPTISKLKNSNYFKPNGDDGTPKHSLILKKHNIIVHDQSFEQHSLNESAKHLVNNENEHQVTQNQRLHTDKSIFGFGNMDLNNPLLANTISITIKPELLKNESIYALKESEVKIIMNNQDLEIPSKDNEAASSYFQQSSHQFKTQNVEYQPNQDQVVLSPQRKSGQLQRLSKERHVSIISVNNQPRFSNQSNLGAMIGLSKILGIKSLQNQIQFIQHTSDEKIQSSNPFSSKNFESEQINIRDHLCKKSAFFGNPSQPIDIDNMIEESDQSSSSSESIDEYASVRIQNYQLMEVPNYLKEIKKNESNSISANFHESSNLEPVSFVKVRQNEFIMEAPTFNQASQFIDDLKIDRVNSSKRASWIQHKRSSVVNHNQILIQCQEEEKENLEDKQSENEQRSYTHIILQKTIKILLFCVILHKRK